MNPRFMWPAVVLAGMGVAAAAVMAIMKVPQETILFVMSVIVVPVLTAMVAAQVADVKSTASQVQQQTNGINSKLMEIIDHQSRLLGSSTPARPPADGEPSNRS